MDASSDRTKEKDFVIDWQTICPFIQQLIAVIADLSEAQVTWRDQKQPYNPSALVKLHTTAERSIGTDYDVIEGDDLYTYGHRAWTLNIQVEAVSQEFDAWAPYYVSKLRTRFQRQTTRDQLRRVATSIIQDFPSIDVPLIDGSRHWSMYQDSYEMNTSFRHLDDSVFDGIPAANWIERCRVVGSVDDRIETDQTVILGREFDSGFDGGFQKTTPPVIS